MDELDAVLRFLPHALATALAPMELLRSNEVVKTCSEHPLFNIALSKSHAQFVRVLLQAL